MLPFAFHRAARCIIFACVGARERKARGHWACMSQAVAWGMRLGFAVEGAERLTHHVESGHWLKSAGGGREC